MNLDELPPAVKVEQAATVLSISRGAAYEAVRRGEIPSIKLGRSIRIPRRALLELLGEPSPEMRVPVLDGHKARANIERDESSAAPD